jgi:hypothetical protein
MPYNKIPDIPVSDVWRAKVALAKHSKQFETQISAELAPSLRPYLKTVLLRDSYPVNVAQLLALAVGYREGIDRAWLYDGVSQAEYDDAMTVGPLLEQALRDKISK